MEKKLNVLLADLVVEYHKLQNFHWYVKGKDFFTAHAKLEELYDGVNKTIDEVGEYILMSGGKPLGSLKEFLEVSSIEEAKMEFVKSKEIYQEVLSDFNKLLQDVMDVKDIAEEEENYLISAAMDDYIKHFTKSIWMLRQMFEE